jgi:hypothetical protein
MRPPYAFPFQGTEPGEAAEATRAAYEAGQVYTGEHARQLEDAMAWLYCCECRAYPLIVLEDYADDLDGVVIARFYVDAQTTRLRATMSVTPTSEENEITLSDGVNDVVFLIPDVQGTPDPYLVSGPMVATPGACEITLSLAAGPTHYAAIWSCRFFAYRLMSF